MILTFDPRYRFHNRHTVRDQIMLRFEEQKLKVKVVIEQILGMVSFTADMWTARNNAAFLSLTIHYVNKD